MWSEMKQGERRFVVVIGVRFEVDVNLYEIWGGGEETRVNIPYHAHDGRVHAASLPVKGVSFEGYEAGVVFQGPPVDLIHHQMRNQTSRWSLAPANACLHAVVP